MKLTTTYQLLRQYDACDGRYDHLKGKLKERGHRGAIPLSLILEVNGLDDALWALVAVPKAQKATRDRRARLFACACAERVLPLYEAKYPEDNCVRSSIECARLFANGEATADKLAAAWAAARAASWVAPWAAASDAARPVASNAAWVASRATAWAAARDVERSWQAERLAWYLDGEPAEVK